jgi:hypothetical protein
MFQKFNVSSFNKYSVWSLESLMSEETCKIVYTFDISFYNICFWTCDILHKNDVYSGSIEKSCLDLNWWIFLHLYLFFILLNLQCLLTMKSLTELVIDRNWYAKQHCINAMNKTISLRWKNHKKKRIEYFDSCKNHLFKLKNEKKNDAKEVFPSQKHDLKLALSWNTSSNSFTTSIELTHLTWVRCVECISKKLRSLMNKSGITDAHPIIPKWLVFQSRKV